MKLLLVEDDASFGYIMKEYLEMNEFEVDWAKDGEQASRKIQKEPFDMIILDVMLPKKDGFTLAAEIKETLPDTPVLFLTAKSLRVDKLKGFKLGCDDYIVKPPDEELLVAKIRAILKRNVATRPKQNGIYKLGKYQFDSSNQLLILDEQRTKLTQKETKVLKLLSENVNNLIDRRKMLLEVWGTNDEFSRKSMDVFIFKLRKHLSRDSRLSICNFHGKGFMLEYK
jgi:DNA-binding response OmpR family regulator